MQVMVSFSCTQNFNVTRFLSLQDEKQSQTEAASLIPHSLPPPEVEIDLDADKDTAESSSGPSATPPPTPPQRMDSISLQ